MTDTAGPQVGPSHALDWAFSHSIYAALPTAAFSSARSPGVVLRVSRMRTPVPSIAATKRAVSVATPDRWPSRLRAVRSPASRARAGPKTRAAIMDFQDRGGLIPDGHVSGNLLKALS